MGNWIGGDRDGNPFVTADTLQMALARQSETVLPIVQPRLNALMEKTVKKEVDTVTKAAPAKK